MGKKEKIIMTQIGKEKRPIKLKKKRIWKLLKDRMVIAGMDQLVMKTTHHSIHRS